jgi:hypothetical protein
VKSPASFLLLRKKGGFSGQLTILLVRADEQATFLLLFFADK